MSMGSGDAANFEEINITPLTDVFLVLLVIMILIAPIIDKSELKIKPPDTRNAKKADEAKELMVDIDKEGKMAIGAKNLPPGATSEEIQRIIKEHQKRLGREDIAITVNADAESRQRDVVAIMSAAAACGVKKMRVATMQTSNY